MDRIGENYWRTKLYELQSNKRQRRWDLTEYENRWDLIENKLK
tara:strand:+ start:683 stop:811 length:129 start_codon:yes stop_codon:yes gene_type:complete